MKHRRHVLFLIAMILTISALTIGQSIFAADKTELRVLTQRVEDKDYYDLINAKFEQENPDINVNYDAVPTANYSDVLTARIAANQVDALVANGPYFDPDKRRALFLDQTGQPYLKYILPDALKAAVKPGDNGAQYGIPMNSVAIVVFYNKKIYKDLGLSIPKTFDQFVDNCNKIKASGIDPLIFGGKDQWPVNMIVCGLEAPLVSAVDPDWYTKLKEGKVKFTDGGTWLEVFKRLNIIKDYYDPACLGLGYGQTPGMFAQGRAAMMIDGSWSAVDIEKGNPDFEVGAFLMPASDNAANNQIAPVKSGFDWAIIKNSNQDAALRYTAFLLRPDNYQLYTDMVKMFPVEQGITMQDPLANEIAGLLGHQVLLFENKLSDTVPGCNFTGETTYSIGIFAKTMTPEQAATKMQEDFENSKPNWK